MLQIVCDSCVVFNRLFAGHVLFSVVCDDCDSSRLRLAESSRGLKSATKTQVHNRALLFVVVVLVVLSTCIAWKHAFWTVKRALLIHRMCLVVQTHVLPSVFFISWRELASITYLTLERLFLFWC